MEPRSRGAPRSSLGAVIVLGFTLAMVAADMATEHEGARKDWLGSSIALGIASGMALICPLGLAAVIGLLTREQVWYWTVGAAVASSGLAARRNRTVRVRLDGTMLVVPHAWGTHRYPVGQISTAVLNSIGEFLDHTNRAT